MWRLGGQGRVRRDGGAAATVDQVGKQAAGPPEGASTARTLPSPPPRHIRPQFGLPPGYNEGPYEIVGDPTGAGAWFLAASNSDTRLFNVSLPSGQLRSWPLGRVGVGLQTSMAVAPGGIVWVGSGISLLQVDTLTGTVTTIPLPAVPGSPAAMSHEPLAVRSEDAHSIDGLALLSDGSVVISRASASAYQVYDPATGGFYTLDLPPDVAAAAAAGAGDTYAVAALGYDGARSSIEVASLGPGQTGAAPEPPQSYASDVNLATSSSMSASGGVILAGDLPSGVVRVSSRGVSPVTIPTAPSDAYQPLIGEAPVKTPAGYAYGTHSGLMATTASGALLPFELPTFDCGGASVPGELGSAPPTYSGPCYSYARALGVDGAGDLWYVSSGPGKRVGTIPAADLPG